MIKKIKSLEAEERLFVYMLIFAIVLGSLNIINNMIIKFDFIANYKWFVLIATAGIGLYYTLQEDQARARAIRPIKFFLFCEIIFVFLPNGWMNIGGFKPSAIAYIFLICIAICFVCEGLTRLFFLLSEIAVILTLLVWGELHPEILVNNSASLIFWDSLIQIPTTITASAILLIMFSNAFKLEQKKLNEYSEMLVQKNQTLFQMTIKDELTALYNRRYIFDQLQSLWRSLESQEAIRLALVDVDNFKRVNDTLGHVIGDKILKQIADIMADSMKDKGFAGRYGGDEFVLVFIGSDIESVMTILNQINEQVKAIDVSPDIRISLSGGISRLTRENNIDSALSRADDILYRSKKDTKDQIISDEIENRL
ncbi:GGDEF domain-containing protein [Fusibacter ferrireducens]|uniref:GGDEF domain-containing protein n=1 Tax=Fusibacter ferrireducens TaxID=2785058 RepID=A0ABR9ZSK5_9FIRM|nr:GGDEF domain-containing protein [Fusibacter ferrireducens]MBF4692865.1 GGDEF domain-containing protein [Fusibacter ferrireducens]